MEGRILDVEVSLGSGLARVVIDDGDDIDYVPISSGFGLRQLSSVLDHDAIGRKINYETDEYGMMSSFSPCD